ncbi:MAG: xanthine dehydrogenase family protein subunit M [Candidatus Saccharibacteria bacterium]|nr:xanthine dehydrogenase family protein subunit M [Moraxellaceae bacterium]
MKAFAYFRAENAVDATKLMNQHHGKYIAGGSNLLDLMKLHLEIPEVLIDISRLPLNDVEETSEGGLKIGAMVLNSELAAHPLVRLRYGVLSRALLAGASGQLRNMATTGGNILQRTRCSYFYAPDSACNKRIKGSGCPALHGLNRMHAILGGSAACIAQHPSDMAVAFMALDAVVVTLCLDGSSRQIPLDDFYRLPGLDPQQETVLQFGELIIHIILPPPPMGIHQYYKVRDRASYAFALVSIASIIDIDDRRIRAIRLAFGGIGTIPWRNKQVEEFLVSAPPCYPIFAQAADILLSGAKGAGENDFKIELTRRLLISTLQKAVSGDHS